MPLDGERKSIPVVRTPADELAGQLSPDGRWIAYNSNRTGAYQVYAERFPPSAGDRECIQLSSGLGHGARWRLDGRELYYFDAGQFMAVPVQTGKTLQLGAPRPLFDISRIYHSSYGYYPAPDGRRFLFSAAIEDEFAHDSAATVAVNRFASF